MKWESVLIFCRLQRFLTLSSFHWRTFSKNHLRMSCLIPMFSIMRTGVRFIMKHTCRCYYHLLWKENGVLNGANSSGLHNLLNVCLKILHFQFSRLFCFCKYKKWSPTSVVRQLFCGHSICKAHSIKVDMNVYAFLSSFDIWTYGIEFVLPHLPVITEGSGVN